MSNMNTSLRLRLRQADWKLQDRLTRTYFRDSLVREKRYKRKRSPQKLKTENVHFMTAFIFSCLKFVGIICENLIQVIRPYVLQDRRRRRKVLTRSRKRSLARPLI